MSGESLEPRRWPSAPYAHPEIRLSVPGFERALIFSSVVKAAKRAGEVSAMFKKLIVFSPFLRAGVCHVNHVISNNQRNVLRMRKRNVVWMPRS